MSDCRSCYTCEKGIVKHISVDEFKEAQAKGAVPVEWFTKESSGDCINCVSCEKCFSGQTGASKGKKIFNYFLFLTNECNLSCTYCYATKVPLVMTQETIEQVKLFLTRDEELRVGEHDISIQFFGGEPTLRWDDLQRFVTEFTVLYDKLYGRKVRWGMTTIPTWQLTASWVILVVSATLCLVFAAQIFRVGMLTYGQRLDMRSIRTALGGKGG